MMCKNITILSISLVITVLCSSFTPVKQVIIPLDNSMGIPYYRNTDVNYVDMFMDGFVVDSAENAYFLGGAKKAILFCYSLRDNQAVYRKSIPGITSGSLYIHGNTIYTVSQWNPDNNLWISQIDKNSGTLLSTNKRELPMYINRVIFADGNLSLQYLEKIHKQNNSIDFRKKYVLYDLLGKKIKDIDNIYNLNPSIRSGQGYLSYANYIGRYKNKLILCNLESTTDMCLFFLVNDDGTVVKRCDISFKILGSLFNAASGGVFEDHAIIQNGKLYVLGWKDNNAIITIYTLADLFD